ncbi:MAG: glycoside hydrolase family 127 protein, partial [Lachnospiraceae bacterium]|nr:glycoside hydrolase family 127 protein [Lachnospiraceae bacterium]
MDSTLYNAPLSWRDIRVTDSFWKNEMELVRTEGNPYQWKALNDQVEGAAPSYCMRNFKIAGKLNREKAEKGSAFEEPIYTFRGFEALPDDPEHLEDQFYGFVFQDSDFSKWIEAVGYSLTQHPDPELERIADGAIEIVCSAQQEDGYLDTYYIINGRDKTFSNLRDHHELYCFGHLTEGAVAYYQATGKDRLLKAAGRFADYIVDTFGPEEGKCKGYPGHEIAEMALVRLYEATGEQKYLDLSRFFIDQRGTRPYYFDTEHPEDITPGSENELRYQYQQAHLPVREQDEAVGHAVRAVDLYSGIADVARLTQDESLYNACERLWDN